MPKIYRSELEPDYQRGMGKGLMGQRFYRVSQNYQDSQFILFLLISSILAVGYFLNL